jgi:hypothetical protein
MECPGGLDPTRRAAASPAKPLDNLLHLPREAVPNQEAINLIENNPLKAAVCRSDSGRLSVFIRWLSRCPGVATRRVMPLRSRAFSDLRFSPPKRHPGTILGNKDWNSRLANKCICVAGLHVGYKRTHHVPPNLRSAPAAPAPPPGEGRRGCPSLVEEARQWTIGRRYASIFPLSISLCTNRFLPTPPRRRSSMLRSPPLQGNSAAMQRDWMAVSRSNLNGPAGNVSA